MLVLMFSGFGDLLLHFVVVALKKVVRKRFVVDCLHFFFLALLIVGMLFVFMMCLEVSRLRLIFGFLIFHFTQKMFVYGLQLEHQVLKFTVPNSFRFLNLSNLTVSLRSSGNS